MFKSFRICPSRQNIDDSQIIQPPSIDAAHSTAVFLKKRKNDIKIFKKNSNLKNGSAGSASYVRGKLPDGKDGVQQMFLRGLMPGLMLGYSLCSHDPLKREKKITRRDQNN